MPTDLTATTNTRRGLFRYKRFTRRIRAEEKHYSSYKTYPISYGADDSTSEEEEPDPERPPQPKYRAPVPGDFVLTFNVLARSIQLKFIFPHWAEYWFTVLPGTLDQVCACFSIQRWVDELVSCEDQKSLLTVYQNFLDTTWEAVEGSVQYTGEFH